MRNQSTVKFVYLALLCAIAITLSIVESVYIGPFLFGILKIGLANIAALLTIRLMGVKEMIIVNVMRVVISTLMQGTFLGSVFWISAGGVILSSLTLVVLDHFHSSLIFTSIMSAIAHSCGQVIMVALFYMQPGIAVLLPYLLLGSIPMGVLTGIVAQLVLKRIKPLRKEKN